MKKRVRVGLGLALIALLLWLFRDAPEFPASQLRSQSAPKPVPATVSALKAALEVSPPVVALSPSVSKPQQQDKAPVPKEDESVSVRTDQVDLSGGYSPKTDFLGVGFVARSSSVVPAPSASSSPATVPFIGIIRAPASNPASVPPAPVIATLEPQGNPAVPSVPVQPQITEVKTQTAAQLRFSVSPPTTGRAGESFGFAVMVLDQDEQQVASSAARISIAAFRDSLCTEPALPAPGGAANLGGNLEVAASEGIARLERITSTRAGLLYVKASAGILKSACSSAIEISSGPAQDLVRISGDSQSGTAGEQLEIPLVVEVRDEFGNPVPNASMSFAVQSGGGSVSPAQVASDASGRASTRFTLGTNASLSQSVRVTNEGRDVSFTATAVAGALHRLTLLPATLAPSAGDCIQVVISREDSYQNLASPATATAVNLSVTGGGGFYDTNNCSGAMTAQTTIASGSSGTVVFFKSTLAGAKTITASSNPLQPASEGLMVVPGSPSRLAFKKEPGNDTAGRPFRSQPEAEIRDQYDNPVPACSTGNSSFQLSLAEGDGVLSSTDPVQASQALANWSGLSINTVGAKRIRASGSCGGVTLSPVVSGVFTLRSAVFKGWTGIKAVGRKMPSNKARKINAVGDSVPMDQQPAEVTLSWDEAAQVSPSGPIEGYNIYRATTPGGQDYNSPLNGTLIGAAVREFTDAAVVGGATYYYTIAPVVAGAPIQMQNDLNSTDREVTIITPPANMVLLHRWAANREMCEEMMRTGNQATDSGPVQRNNHYRCFVKNGAAGMINGHFDLGYSMFVDAYGQGCNYDEYDTAETSPDGRISASEGTIFYSRKSGYCSYSEGRPEQKQWRTAMVLTGGTSPAVLNKIASNEPGLPPLVNLSQSGAAMLCGAQTISVGGQSLAKRLIRRKEQILVSAWKKTLSDAEILNIERGTFANSCNTNGGQGLAFDDSNTANDRDQWARSLTPDSIASAHRAVRIGSDVTRNCVSRYGAQDMVGNVRQWASEKFKNSVQYPANGEVEVSSWDPANQDFSGVTLTQNSTTISVVKFTRTNQILLPLGIPVNETNASANSAHSIHTFSASRFRENTFMSFTGDAALGLAYGGASQTDTLENRNSIAGRFWFRIRSSGERATGFRCGVQLPEPVQNQ